MDKKPTTVNTCPKCGKAYSGVPALSREDSETFICPECATRESLAYLGIDKEEQEQILKIIRDCQNRSQSRDKGEAENE